MTIALLGGRFDPPHIWHFWVARQVLENVSGIDQVWLMPDCQNAFKKIETSFADRIDMLSFMENNRIKLSTEGIARKGITYTIDVVSQLIKRGANRYLWIVGSDSLAEFDRWKDYRQLKKLIKFLVFPRRDYPIVSMPNGFQLVSGNLMTSNISSTSIRQRVKDGLSITGLVFPEVEGYIKENGLYK